MWKTKKFFAFNSDSASCGWERAKTSSIILSQKCRLCFPKIHPKDRISLLGSRIISWASRHRWRRKSMFIAHKSRIKKTRLSKHLGATLQQRNQLTQNLCQEPKVEAKRCELLMEWIHAGARSSMTLSPHVGWNERWKNWSSFRGASFWVEIWSQVLQVLFQLAK